MMRLPFLLLAALLALLIPTGLMAADAVVAPAPVSGVTGNATMDLILGIVGIVNMAATALAALLPSNSAVGWIARIAGLANTLGVTVKPHAVKPAPKV